MGVAVWLDNFFRKILPFFTCKVLFSKDERILEGGDICYVLKITFNFDTM
jgi:hypothetical protein